MTLPLPNLDDRKLTMREQVIARLRQLNPDVMYREEYLNTLKDFALLQALECAIQVHLDRTNEEMAAHMFNAGMDYERQRIAKELTETRLDTHLLLEYLFFLLTLISIVITFLVLC